MTKPHHRLVLHSPGIFHPWPFICQPKMINMLSKSWPRVLYVMEYQMLILLLFKWFEVFYPIAVPTHSHLIHYPFRHLGLQTATAITLEVNIFFLKAPLIYPTINVNPCPLHAHPSSRISQFCTTTSVIKERYVVKLMQSTMQVKFLVICANTVRYRHMENLAFSSITGT